LQKYFAFEFVGTRGANLTEQLESFKKALGKAIGSDKLYQVPETWADAFDSTKPLPNP
jgi:hypothetical protein